MRPGRPLITTTRSARNSASSTEWVISMVVIWRADQMRCSSTFIWRRVTASSAPNGSSSSSTSGSSTSARAIEARWRMPPDSWRGRALPKVPSPTSSIRRVIAGSSTRRPAILNGSAILSCTVSQGSSAWSWNATPSAC